MESRDLGVAVGATILMLLVVVTSGATIARRGAPSLGIRSRGALRVLTVLDFVSLLTTIPCTIILYFLCMQALNSRRQN
ncbi:IMV membrane protein [Orf virus]|uniref:IMV membrane protein n=1 Tax=Orf virus TaxID=10258 RepID=A0A0R8I8K2_ORFV|nr:IMV membrane protein [Orf virus]AKU76654.1 IMV membrane protein [Orf virus]AKU76786.1 IMV membrane protein [Orf virus]AKU76910.1 IMV membrane protein [Orf virus]AYM25974.1 IMv membrane protein [Orf virus]